MDSLKSQRPAIAGQYHLGYSTIRQIVSEIGTMAKPSPHAAGNYSGTRAITPNKVYYVALQQKRLRPLTALSSEKW
jgi:hypothetical protein